MKAYAFYYLGKLDEDSKAKEQHMNSSLELYQLGLNLAQENLLAHHWLRLQLSLDVANVYIKYFKQQKIAFEIANKAFDAAIYMMTDINEKPDINYERVLVILQKMRDLQTSHRGE